MRELIEESDGKKARRNFSLDGDKLAERGLSPELQAEVVELLERCSEVRFEPALQATAADEVVRRAQRLTRELIRTRTQAAGGEAEPRD